MEENPITDKKEKSNFKKYIILMLLILLLGLAGYSYYKYDQYKTGQDKARLAVEENVQLRATVNTYNELISRIDEEQNRCEDLLLKQEGNFAEFSYCQRLLQFLEQNKDYLK